MPLLTSSVVYEQHMDKVFPWKALVPEHLAAYICMTLAGSTEDFPEGSTFSTIAGVVSPGFRLMHFSHASRTRLAQLAKAGSVEGEIQFHRTFEDGDASYE